MRKIIFALLATLLSTAAIAQPVQQSGGVTQGHVAKWIGPGIIADGGTAANGSLTSIGTTASGPSICANSAAVTAIGFQRICFGATTAGGGELSVQNFGTAPALPLSLNINGTIQSLVTALGPFSANSSACFSTTAGDLLDCGLKISAGTVTAGNWAGTAIPVIFGGTGAATAATARTNLGLGTMAVQNAASVAITGGAIACVNSPVAATDCVNKQYADGLVTGLIILGASRLASAAVLPNSPTYANGTLGVGATLTAGSNTTLTIDGTVAALNDVVLVKNQVSTFQNGIYVVSQAGSGSLPWILTRATYFDQAAEMLKGSYTLITAGATNINSSWTLTANIATVGTDALTFNQFAAAPVVPATRPLLSGDTTFTAASTGSDSNDCITLPCLTLQVAYNKALTYDANNHNVSFQVTSPYAAAGPLTATTAIIGVLGNTITLTGDPTTPANVLITNANNNAFSLTAPMTFNLNGFKVTTTGAANTGAGISLGRYATVNYQNMDFGLVTYNHTDNIGGTLNCQGTNTITGGAQTHDHLINFGITSNACNIIVRNAPAWGARFVGVGGGFATYGDAVFTYPNGPATGSTYFVHDGGIMTLNNAGGTVALPGTAGTGNYSGGNLDDHIGAQSISTPGAFYWRDPSATPTTALQPNMSFDGTNVRMVNSTHSIVIQNPFLYAGPGGSCQPSSVC